MKAEGEDQIEPKEGKQNWTKMYFLILAVLAVQVALYYWFTITFS